jgi:hypothetical protein
MSTKFLTQSKDESTATEAATVGVDEPNTPCTCAVFMTGQFTKGSSQQPKGVPAIVQELETMYPCSPKGTKTCTNKCLQLVSGFYLLYPPTNI